MAGVAVLVLTVFQQATLGSSASAVVIASSLSLPALFWVWRKLPSPETLPLRFAGRFGEKFRRLYASCHAYRQERGLLARVALLALASHTGAILTVYLLSVALGIHVGVIYFFLFIPLITVFTMLPVSLGGVGIQEGAFAYFFSLVGMPLAGALALSILLRTLSIITALPGGFLVLSNGNYRLAY